MIGNSVIGCDEANHVFRMATILSDGSIGGGVRVITNAHCHRLERETSKLFDDVSSLVLCGEEEGHLLEIPRMLFVVVEAKGTLMWHSGSSLRGLQTLESEVQRRYYVQGYKSSESPSSMGGHQSTSSRIYFY